MISYQWESQERMLRLRDELQSAGYNVWMDVDQIGKDAIKLYKFKAKFYVIQC